MITAFHGQKATLTRTFTKEDVKKSSELTNDYSPVYTIGGNRWTSQYPKPIVPALLTESLITQLISERLPGTPCILVQKDLVYYSPVYVGDAVTAELVVIDIHDKRNWITEKVTCYDSDGNEVIKGQVVVYVLENS
ncbi:MaoC/PaaZ C-terminal domain-containing protein [Geomicrobium sp. JCM 19038]|uniref:MaoC/PaaZ C-terminal domain-containing protein n=1 Tax=Geomicrobium sp. JCM 19038 TaxID=1460635 RepID=UPI00045F3D35|nr:MaoC/PaaZ C-terminal domain-containing protein [Geomicrobium sp. JCM 19038]GAK06752.1 3-hydroxybutyryl-CoA dehydratase [Geomicrobium sp. JCM 19038]